MYTNYLFLSDKFKKSMKAVAFSLVSSLIVIPATTCNDLSDILYKDYSTEKQIETIANHLDFNLNDTLKFEKTYHGRFIHNNGKPIQVVIKPELKEYSHLIKSALDTMIGHLHAANNKYSYKIVDKANLTESVITFETGHIDDPFALGTVDKFKTTNMASKLNNKLLINKASVVIDLENYKQYDAYMQEYVMHHELAHLLGLRTDVYTLGEKPLRTDHAGNSFINVGIGSSVNMLTPYDMKSVFCLYTEAATSKEDLTSKIDYAKDYIANYSSKYYDYYSTRIKELTIQQSGNMVTQFDSVDPNENFIFSYSISAENKGLSYSCNYDITYQNNAYNFKIYDENNNLLEDHSGDVVIANDVIILQDVKLNKGLRPNNLFEATPDGYLQDLALVKSNDKIYLFDCYDKNFVHFGTTKFLENEYDL